MKIIKTLMLDRSDLIDASKGYSIENLPAETFSKTVEYSIVLFGGVMVKNRFGELPVSGKPECRGD